MDGQIEDGEKKSGVLDKTAEKSAWATVIRTVGGAGQAVKATAPKKSYYHRVQNMDG